MNCRKLLGRLIGVFLIISVIVVGEIGSGIVHNDIYAADYSNGGCVSWVKARASQIGVSLPATGLNSYGVYGASAYWSKLPSYGYSTGSEPAANALAVWEFSSVSSYRTYGHVAYVESVNGNNVTLTEGGVPAKYSYGGNSGVRQVTVNKSAVASLGGCSGFLGYIYLKDKPSTSYNPEGCVDSITGGKGQFSIAGWTFDRDEIAVSNDVHVYVGNDLVGGWTANSSRTDVDAVYQCGAFHGFDLSITTDKTGWQHVAVYAINKGGGSNVLIGEKDIYIEEGDKEAPIISDVEISNKTKEGYTVTCTVKDNVGVTKVMFPSWNSSSTTGNDAVWLEGTISGNKATCRVNYKDLKKCKYGADYMTHIYAYDAAGNSSCYDTEGVYFGIKRVEDSKKIEKTENGFRITEKIEFSSCTLEDFKYVKPRFIVRKKYVANAIYEGYITDDTLIVDITDDKVDSWFAVSSGIEMFYFINCLSDDWGGYMYCKDDNSLDEFTNLINKTEIETEVLNEKDLKVKKGKKVDINTVSSPRIESNYLFNSGKKIIYDTVWFGDYPQTEILSDSSVYVELQQATGWVDNEIILNGTKYKRMTYRDASYVLGDDSLYYDYFYDWNIEEEGEKYHYFVYEPIKWRILDVEDNKVLLLSDVVLDAQPFNKIDCGSYWENCTIRSWMNGYSSEKNTKGIDYTEYNFIDKAFSDLESKAIILSQITNEDNNYYDQDRESQIITECGNDTEDKIFLLSKNDICNEKYGFSNEFTLNDEARRCLTSDYSIAMGKAKLPFKDSKYGNYYLRTNGVTESCVAVTDFTGKLSLYGTMDNLSNTGFRPAMWVDVSDENPVCYYAGTVCTDGMVIEEMLEYQVPEASDDTIGASTGGSVMVTDKNIDSITGKQYGDSDLDGKITLKDAQLALKAALGIDKISDDVARIMSGGKDKVVLKNAQIILKLALGIDKTYYNVE